MNQVPRLNIADVTKLITVQYAEEMLMPCLWNCFLLKCRSFFEAGK